MKTLVILLAFFQTFAFGADPSTAERIKLYKEEAERYLSMQQYHEACKFLTVAFDLAVNEEIDASQLEILRRSKNRSCELNRAQVEADSKAHAEMQKKLCEHYEKIILSCSLSGDIDGCVTINSKGVSLQAMKWKCAFN